MNRSRARVLALGLAFGLVAMACSGGGDDSTSDTAPATTTEAPTTSTSSTSTSTTSSTTTAPPTTTTAPPPPTTARPPGPTVAPTPIDPTSPVGQRIQRGANDKPFIALTFDAGSDYGYTDQILDFLKAEGIKASFGMTGTWAEKYPDGFKRIVAEGHHLINHSYSHGSWTGLSSGKAPMTAEQRRRELTRADDVFMSLGATTTKPWYRPPYGDLDRAGEALLGAEGYPYIAMWSVDTLGWQGLAPEAIASRCAKGTVAGAIFLFHVGIQSQDANALPAIVATIREAGLKPGNVVDVTM